MQQQIIMEDKELYKSFHWFIMGDMTFQSRDEWCSMDGYLSERQWPYHVTEIGKVEK